MSSLSGKAVRTIFFVVALSGAALWALHAMSAKADPPSAEDMNAPCEEGRALFTAKLAYLELRIAPEPDQQEAWRRFMNTMRTSGGDLDRACVEVFRSFLPADGREKLARMAKHAAAMQAMFDSMAKAYVAIAPNLTTAQRDILSRAIVPAPPFPGPPPPGGFGAPPHPRGMILTCGPAGPGSRPGWTPPWGAPPF